MHTVNEMGLHPYGASGCGVYINGPKVMSAVVSRIGVVYFDIIDAVLFCVLQGFVLTCSTYLLGPGVKLELSANAEMWTVSQS